MTIYEMSLKSSVYEVILLYFHSHRFSNVRCKNRQNVLECAILQLKFQKFSGGFALDRTPMQGRGCSAPPQTLSLGAPVLRASRASFGGLRPLNRPSMSRNGEIKSWQPYTYQW